MSVPAKLSPLRRTQYQHVCVATDFSAGAAEPVARAARLPIADGGRITIVHVLPDDLPQKARTTTEKAAVRKLDHLVAALAKSTSSGGGTDVEIASELCPGRAHVEIIRHGRSIGADLIVLGRHGQRRVKDMFIGSTAERVIRVGTAPVLVVSRKATRPYQRPVLAIDIEDTARSVVDAALHLLAPDVTSATMVHAYHVPFEGFITPAASPGDTTEMRKEYRQTAVSDLARFQASLGDVGIRWRTSILRGDPRTVILTETVRNRADLLAVGTHGRKGLSHALIGSVAEWIIRAAECDVLVARPARMTFQLP